jgi:hypothetical protein
MLAQRQSSLSDLSGWGFLVVGENILKFGNPILNPYLQGSAGLRTILPYSGLPGFSYPIVFGILNILFSMGKGALILCSGPISWPR